MEITINEKQITILNVPSHEKTCINDIKIDSQFLHTTCTSNCAEQILNISCRYLE